MTQDGLLVSVVIPNYNGSRTLGLCVHSALDQTYSPTEVIVVDDCSTDDSAQIAESLGATVVRAPLNGGTSAARNLGVRHAQGEILFFLDSDVSLEPGGIAAAVAELLADPALGAICGVYHLEPLLPSTLVAGYRRIQQYVWFNEVEGTIPGLHTALFAIRREVFDEIGPFNPKLRYANDQDYATRLGRRYRVRATAAIQGRHDHDATLRAVLFRVFQRARLGAPLWLQRRRLPGGSATPTRALASVLVCAAALSLPLSLLVGLPAVLATLIFIGAAIALDRTTYRSFLRGGNVPVGLVYVAIHLAVNLTSAFATGVGILERLLRPGAVSRRYLRVDPEPHRAHA